MSFVIGILNASSATRCSSPRLPVKARYRLSLLHSHSVLHFIQPLSHKSFLI